MRVCPRLDQVRAEFLGVPVSRAAGAVVAFASTLTNWTEAVSNPNLRRRLHLLCGRCLLVDPHSGYRLADVPLHLFSALRHSARTASAIAEPFVS